MRQSLCLDFSIIENFESLQTINNKRKYKIQQLFKLLSLSLDTRLMSFSPLVSGPVNDGQPQTLTTSGFSSGRSGFLVYVLLQCSAWCCCCHENRAVGTQPISSFSNAVNSQLNADASSEKLFITALF